MQTDDAGAKRVLVTGATGMVGCAVVDSLLDRGHVVLAATRRADASPIRSGVTAIPFDLAQDPALDPALLQDLDAVVHLAGRVHVMQRGDIVGAEAEFERCNSDATRRLAQLAAEAGVRRFVFASSIKVNGEMTIEAPFSGDDPPDPQDPYARSKLHAEEYLWGVAHRTGLEVAIVRPTLVYGPHVRANFLALLRLVAAGVPLPFASIYNSRSLVSVWNLASLFCRIVETDAGVGRVWLVSDGEDLSTPELVRRLGRALGVAPRLVPVPPRALEWSGRLVGKTDYLRRLTGSLRVDMRRTQLDLGWTPPVSVDVGLGRTAEWYRARRSRS